MYAVRILYTCLGRWGNYEVYIQCDYQHLEVDNVFLGKFLKEKLDMGCIKSQGNLILGMLHAFLGGGMSICITKSLF